MGFKIELPTEIMRDIQRIDSNVENILGKMTQAGAEVVKSNIEANIPDSIRQSDMMNCLKITRTFKTPSDDAVNTKVGFYGYFINDEGQRVPAPLVGNVFEYGRSNLPFPKHPFLRKSFKKSQIEEAMLKAQIEASGGILT